MGGVGRRNTTNSDALGVRFLYGGRVFLVLPLLGDRWFIKPSLGLFTRSEGIGTPSVTEYQGEVGASIEYRLGRAGNFTFLLGLAQRLELNMSRTSVGLVEASTANTAVSQTSPIGLRYRLGPTASTNIRASKTLGFVLNLETSFSFTNPVRPYLGVTGGMIFKL